MIISSDSRVMEDDIQDLDYSIRVPQNEEEHNNQYGIGLALEDAAEHNRMHIVRTIENDPAFLFITLRARDLAMCQAARRGHKEMIQRLLDIGCRPDAVGHDHYYISEERAGHSSGSSHCAIAT